MHYLIFVVIGLAVLSGVIAHRFPNSRIVAFFYNRSFGPRTDVENMSKKDLFNSGIKFILFATVIAVLMFLNVYVFFRGNSTYEPLGGLFSFLLIIPLCMCLLAGLYMIIRGVFRKGAPGFALILHRALCLTAILQRAVCEENLQAGKDTTLNADTVCNGAAINAWLDRMRTRKYLTKRERTALLLPDGKWRLDEIDYASWCTEILGVLLWSLTIVYKIPGYDECFDKEKVLGSISDKKSFQEVMALSKQRPRDVVDNAWKIAEAWDWRVGLESYIAEGGQPPKGKTHEELIKETADILYSNNKIPKPIEGDFPSLGKAFARLTGRELDRISGIVGARNFAFAWLSGEVVRWH